MVFDFDSAPKKEAGADKPVVTYTEYDNDKDTASFEYPIMVLDDSNFQIPHHQNGVFNEVSIRTSFKLDGDGKKEADITIIDARFKKFLEWIGSKRLHVRLSGKHTEKGYCIYRIHVINKQGKLQNDTDTFVQYVIGRILSSQIMEEDVDEDADDANEVRDDEIMLADMNSIEDFLNCASSVIPTNIRRWAQRNIAVSKSGTISQDERRHAQRALAIMLNIKWKGSYFESIDPEEARRILDEELYGMENVKQRIIETIIQINRTHTLPAYGLLLAGPAGVGKSQLAYAVARIMKLPWTGLDMSAIRDSEALTGSPRVYTNAKPGLIMEAFSKAGSSNLVFIINELDKADSNSDNGNPADALLTLLDNIGYTDNYIECMIPTNGVYPIATANDKDKISAPLMSRFAVLDIPDYTPKEKATIFKKFSLPKVLKRMGIKEHECVVNDEGVAEVVKKCEGTTGCRDLEQAAEHLAANALYQIETKNIDSVTFDKEMVDAILGK